MCGGKSGRGQTSIPRKVDNGVQSSPPSCQLPWFLEGKHRITFSVGKPNNSYGGIAPSTSRSSASSTPLCSCSAAFANDIPPRRTKRERFAKEKKKKTTGGEGASGGGGGSNLLSSGLNMEATPLLGFAWSSLPTTKHPCGV